MGSPESPGEGRDDIAATRALPVAATLAALEAGVLLAVLASRGALAATPLRAVFVLAKLPFCVAAARRRPGAYLALWLWELAAVGAAAVTPGAVFPRAVVGGLAVTVMVLLGRAARAFPTVELPAR